ncbi:MAG: ATP-binding cassette domain-containing protein [Coprobacillus sp.]
MELIIENMSKSFKKTQAVKNIDLSLGLGIHALLGPNGSGKTTLMRMVCGILNGEGSIHLDEINIKTDYDLYASHIGYLPQKFGYYPHYTVKEFLEYMAIVKNLTHEYSQQRIHVLAKRMGLEDKLNHKMKSLSGGMIKRVGIIQALLNEPQILVLDEPTAGLDPKERIIFRNFIASLSETTIVLLSTHIVSDIETIADDIMIMKEGEIMHHGAYNDLMKVVENKVWEVVLPRQDGKKFLIHHRVVKSHNRDDGIYMRVVSDEKPHELAINVEPDLDDLYLYYFAEDNLYETTDS